MSQVIALAKAAQQAARVLATASRTQKDAALKAMAASLIAAQSAILEANNADAVQAKAAGITRAFLDRLLLTESRIQALANGLLAVAELPDPIGASLGSHIGESELRIERRRVPLGVIGIIYEARPNVTADAAGLCLKSGNACVLRGGSEAIRTNIAIVAVLRSALEQTGLPADCVALIEDTDRACVQELMTAHGLIDVLIPRGGAGLIQSVMENARMPVIETGVGVCHTYVDDPCDVTMAVNIAVNAKISRPSVCNAMETLLVHRDVAQEFLPRCLRELNSAGVEIRGDEVVCRVWPDAKPAQPTDWGNEFLDYILAIRVVKGLDDALEHIHRYGTRHSEAIVTSDFFHAERFLNEVDAAAVYVNASTRFTDGAVFGLGAEIGISTQKLHARGPMGLNELTSIKYVIHGNGQVRT